MISDYNAFFDEKKDVNVLIFAGKGGLGKTTFAAATAVYFAKKGKKVLVFSTDPQASLSDIFELDVFGKGEIQLDENLYVVEIDADREIEDFLEETRHKILELYGLDEIPEEINEYINSAAAEPAMHESATYDAMVRLVSEGKFDLYIFDMPPFGHGVRFISMADVLDSWIEKMTEMRKKAEEYDEIAYKLRSRERTQELAQDAIMEELTEIRAKLNFFSKMLKNTEKTGFFMVLVPEQMAILDTQRAIEMFEYFGVTISGIVVNMVYPIELFFRDDCGLFLKNRILMQQKHLGTIFKEFGKQLLSIVPMFEREPKGKEMLDRVGSTLFDWDRNEWNEKQREATSRLKTIAKPEFAPSKEA